MGFKGKICGVSILRAGEVSAPLVDTTGSSITSHFVGYGSGTTGSMQECKDWKDTYPEGMFPCTPFGDIWNLVSFLG